MKDVILVVDDNPMNLKLVTFILNQHYRVIVAQDGTNAITIAEQKQPDLILLDIMMPGMDGYEVCRKLKEISVTKEIPIIFLTAKTGEKDIVEAYKSGGIDYITKPFKPDEMLARIKTHLDLADARNRIVNQNKELRELLERSDKFVSIIAHNLKTPFNGLLGLTQILLEDNDDIGAVEKKELLESIYKSAETAYFFVEDLLIWSRIQTGRIIYEPEFFPIKPLVTEVIANLDSKLKSKNIALKHSYINAKSVVFADPNLIKIVIDNLLSNSIKFSNKDNEIEIGVNENENDIVLFVKDNGIGISEDNQKRLFKIDEEVSTYGTDREKGTGIGLLIAKELLKMNNGKIWFESTVNIGSTFFFSLNKL